MMEEGKKERTRKKIMDAAVEEFTLKGITAAAFDDIAKKAGIARRTLYYHFKNKEELLRTIIDTRFEAGMIELKNFQDGKADIDKLAEFCLSFWRSDPGLASLFRRIKEERIPDFSEAHDHFIDEFKNIFVSLKDTEKLRFDNPEVNIRIIFFGLFPMLEVISSEADYEEKFLEIFRNTLLNA